MKKKLKKTNVLLAVSGGIAAYKSCYLTRLLVKSGFSVKVMMTEAATKFVSPLTFQTLSTNHVYLDMFELIKEESTQHISLSKWADICVIAPASANTISKIAQGICDNLLSTVVSALDLKTKVIIASAMNDCMWNNPLIQDNVKKLKRIKKYTILNPEKGQLACGSYGEGRMPEPETIFKKIKSFL